MPDVALYGERGGGRRRRGDDDDPFRLPPLRGGGTASYTTPGYQPSDDDEPTTLGDSSMPTHYKPPTTHWFEDKLNDPFYKSPKYDWGRALQVLGNYARGDLQPWLDQFNQRYGYNARVTGEDKVDFGQGDIDVLLGSGDPWFELVGGGAPTTNRSTPQGGYHTTPASSAGAPSSPYRYSPELEGAVRYDPVGRKVLDLYRQYRSTPPTLAQLFEWSDAINRGTSSLAAVEAELKKVSLSPTFRAYDYPMQRTAAATGRGDGSGGGGGSGLPGTEGNFVLPDPYGRQLESLARTRIDQLFKPLGQGPDALSSFDFYRNVFGDLQANPGYSPQERALLQTQVSEPIEARRSASKQRALERASARGFAPTSGLLELDVRDIERGADEARAVADRNLGINEIARRDQRRRQAMEVADYLRMAEEARTLLQEGRYREALQIADRMQALPGERLSLANQTLGTQPASASGYGNALLGASQLENMDAAQKQAMYLALAQVFADLFRRDR